MTHLELLTLIMLSNSKELRDNASPSEFGTLGAMVQRVKESPTEAVQEVLRSECGLEWDGVRKLSEVIVEEQKRVSRIEMARAAVEQKLKQLTHARYVLMCPNISGPERFGETVEMVMQMEVES